MSLAIFDYLLGQTVNGTLLLFLFFIPVSIFYTDKTPKLSVMVCLYYFLFLLIPIPQIIELVFPVELSLTRVSLNIVGLASTGFKANEVTANYFPVSLTDLVVIFWGIGASFSFLFFTILPFLKQKKVEIRILGDSENVTDKYSNILSRYGLTSKSIVVNSSAVQAPFVSGFFRHIIFLPAYFESEFGAGSKQLILKHEIAHILHKDSVQVLFARFVLSIFWFFPPIYWSYSLLIQAQEMSADRLALEEENRGERRALAESICFIASKLSCKPFGLQHGIFNKSDLTRRLNMINGFDSKIKRTQWVPVLVVLFVSLCTWASGINGAVNSREPLRIATDVFWKGEIVARPVVTVLANSDFEITMQTNEHEKYQIKGTVKYVKEDIVELSTQHCISKLKSVDSRDCTLQFEAVQRTALGESLLFTAGHSHKMGELSQTGYSFRHTVTVSTKSL